MVNLRRMTSGRDLGHSLRTEVQLFSMRRVGVALLNKILLGRERIGHSRYGITGEHPRHENAKTYDFRLFLKLA